MTAKGGPISSGDGCPKTKSRFFTVSQEACMRSMKNIGSMAQIANAAFFGFGVSQLFGESWRLFQFMFFRFAAWLRLPRPHLQ
jgi:hypothetical protein